MDRLLLLASPRGFCMGVGRALDLLDQLIAQTEGTIYVRKEIVHNAALINHYKSLGVIFVNEVDEVPRGGTVVFSAHGVAPSVRERAKERGLNVVDATCPLVAKIHNEAVRLREQNYSIILIGRLGHKEVIGITGEAPDHIQVIQEEADVEGITGVDPSRIAWLSQTTLNVDDTQRIVERLHTRFPAIQDPPQSDICYATKERQLAVKRIAGRCDLFIVAGSRNSSNTNRLAEVAAEAGASNVIRVDEPEELAGICFSGIATVGVTSGVSVREDQLERILHYLNQLGYRTRD